jgi:phosphoribosylanthranilate isomerase
VGHHLRIKICGITNAEDARQAALLGADAIGLNFCAQSPRYLSGVAEIHRILAALPPFVEAVGVFTDLDAMCDRANWARYRLRTFQWHGDAAELTRFSPPHGIPPRNYLIVAFAVEDAESLAQIPRYLEQAQGQGWRVGAILIDGHQKGLLGGTGQTAPWHLLADFKPAVPLILAGGLTPDNVAEAVRIVRPYAVDVASGVESSPGRKDVEKMKRFIDNARSAAG